MRKHLFLRQKRLTLTPAIIGEKPEAEAVAAIATAKNPADVAYQYLGIDENTVNEGAAEVANEVCIRA